MTIARTAQVHVSAEATIGASSSVRSLLVCGIVSSLLYVAMNVIVPLQWPGYSSTSQTVSELSAIAAPTRRLWNVLAFFYTPLVVAFGCGVWMSAGKRRSLRAVGALLFAFGSLGVVWPFAPMHLRGTLAAGGASFSDTMHLALGAASVLLMAFAIGMASTAFGHVFRTYSIATLVVLLIAGFATGTDAPNIQANRPTPWVGVWERISIGVFLFWVVVLAIVLLRATPSRREGRVAWPGD
jgi:hypothetical protein